MKWIIGFGVGLVSLIAVVVRLLLPEKHRASESAHPRVGTEQLGEIIKIVYDPAASR